MPTVKYEEESVSPIPPFESIEEEAAFWDTHSAVEMIDKGTVAGFHHARKRGSLTVRLKPGDVQRIREEAFRRGFGATSLVKIWILEHLKEGAAPKDHPRPRKGRAKT
jgi:hypothetical protein